MRRRRHLGVLLVLLLATSVLGTLPVINVFATTISVDGNGSGRTFQGVGGVSAGAAARLLNDYPSTQQSQILDYLFRCDTTFCGADLQRLKVEIGGDMNSSWGAEPSIRRSGETAPGYTTNKVQCARGYEFLLMKGAVSRNSNIKLDTLEWGAPGWIGTNSSPNSPNFWSQDNANYVNDFIDCAAEPQNQVNGNPLAISTVGLWNETGWSTVCGGDGVNYIKSYLYPTLQSRHSATKVIAADSPSCGDSDGWGIASNINSDSTLASDVAYLGAHYQEGCGGDPTCQSRLSTAQGLLATSGQYLWSSENTDDPNTGSTPGAIAQILNRDYLNDKQSATLLCCLIDAWFPTNSQHQGQLIGLIQAQAPWGNAAYSVLPQLWIVAHTTQFTQVGWQYLDGAEACLGATDCTIGGSGLGSVVTLKSPGSCPSSCPDFTSVVETTGYTTTQSITYNLSNVHSLSCGCVHVWKSDLGAGTYFVQQSDIAVSGGSFTLSASPNSVYTITTTSGGKKGSYTQNSQSAFPFPWSDSYTSSSYVVGGLPHYLSDQHGAFEIQPCSGGYTGNCLEQVVTTPPICWFCEGAVINSNFTLGTVRNNFTGPVGMVYQTGAGGATVTQLGRIVVSGNTQSHPLSIYLDSNRTTALGSCSVNTSGQTAGQMTYCTLSPSVALAANTSYDVVSQETNNGDQWYDYDTTVGPSWGQVTKAIYNNGTWNFNGGPGNSYGPVDLVVLSTASEPTPMTMLGRRGPAFSPSGTPQSSGSLATGTYTLTYTYVTSGGETEPAPASSSITLDSTHRQISVGAVTPLPGYATAVKWYFASGPTTGFTVQNNGAAFTLNHAGNGTAAPNGNYTIESQEMFVQSGTVSLLGRIQDAYVSGSSYYQFSMTDQGVWALNVISNGGVAATLASGTVTGPGLGHWDTMEMNFSGSTIKVFWDDTVTPIATVTDSTYTEGGVGFGTGWNKVQFSVSCWNTSIGPC